MRCNSNVSCNFVKIPSALCSAKWQRIRRKRLVLPKSPRTLHNYMFLCRHTAAWISICNFLICTHAYAYAYALLMLHVKYHPQVNRHKPHTHIINPHNFFPFSNTSDMRVYMFHFLFISQLTHENSSFIILRVCVVFFYSVGIHSNATPFTSQHTTISIVM